MCIYIQMYFYIHIICILYICIYIYVVHAYLLVQSGTLFEYFSHSSDRFSLCFLPVSVQLSLSLSPKNSHPQSRLISFGCQLYIYMILCVYIRFRRDTHSACTFQCLCSSHFVCVDACLSPSIPFWVLLGQSVSI